MYSFPNLGRCCGVQPRFCSLVDPGFDDHHLRLLVDDRLLGRCGVIDDRLGLIQPGERVRVISVQSCAVAVRVNLLQVQVSIVGSILTWGTFFLSPFKTNPLLSIIIYDYSAFAEFVLKDIIEQTKKEVTEA